MYPQQPYPQYPQQPPAYPQGAGYTPAPAYPQPPSPQPTAAGSLDQFYNQPSSGNKAWSFHQKPIGTTYAGIVARPITNGDIQQQTAIDGSGAPRFFRDGRPMFVMVVPMLVAPSAEFPEGQSSWYVRGQARDELVRAMAEAGAPEGPPEAGAAIQVTLVGQRPGRAGFNPTHIYRVIYRRPDGASSAAPAAAAVPPVNQQPSAPVALTNPPGGSTVPVPVSLPPQPPPQPGPAPQPAMAGNLSGLSAEQQALLAKLTGG